MSPPPTKHRHLVWLSVGAGLLLTVIGIRFLIVPRTAALNFGLAKDSVGQALHHMVGLRDIWLGGLALVLVWLREWRALMWWFVLAVRTFAAATIAYWAIRLPFIWANDHGLEPDEEVGFKLVHTVLAVVSAVPAALAWRSVGTDA